MIWYYNHYYTQLGELEYVGNENIEAKMIMKQDTIYKNIICNERMFGKGAYTSFHDEDVHATKKADKQEKEQNEPIKDCVISIPEIDLKRAVYTGDNRERELEKYNLITAAENMTYDNGGNYIICGHNSRLYGHSLNRLHELKKGDTIYIQYNDKRDQYTVYSIQYHNMYQISDYLQQTQDKELTILSCSNNTVQDEYIIVKCKYKN